MKTVLSLERALDQLPDLDAAALRAHYRRLHPKPAPRDMTRRELELAVGFRLQKRLIAKFRSKMLQALIAADAIYSVLEADSRQTELVGQWKGRVHTVDLVEGAVFYRGKRYRSLPQIAQLITGNRKIGAEFFGVKPKRFGEPQDQNNSP